MENETKEKEINGGGGEGEAREAKQNTQISDNFWYTFSIAKR